MLAEKGLQKGLIAWLAGRNRQTGKLAWPCLGLLALGLAFRTNLSSARGRLYALVRCLVSEGIPRKPL